MFSLKSFLSKNNVLPLILALLLFLKCRPYFVWGWNELLLASLSLVIAFIALSKIDIKDRNRLIAFTVLLLAYFLISFLRGARMGAIIYISLAFIPFMKYDFFMQVYESFKSILAIVLCLSLGSLVLVLTGVLTPSGVIGALNDLKDYAYVQYFMLVIPTHVSDAFARFCSVFDEPGVVGTMCSLILIAEDFRFKDKRNIAFLVSGMLSFSLFFYMIVVIYLLLRSGIKGKIGWVAAILIFYIATRNTELFYDRIWSRLEFGGSGLIEGNNRNSDALLDIWDRYKFTPGIMFGYGDRFVKDFYESASIQLFILRDGFVFVFLYFYSFYKLMCAHISSKRNILIYLAVMFLTLYQRPGFCESDFTLLITAIIIANSSKNVSINNCSQL